MKKLASLRKAFSSRLALGITILIALIAFDLFNYDSTRAALESFFFGATVFGMQWSVVLAIAACGIDLGGVASIFTPERGRDEPMFVWLLGAGWLIASVINALGTWWSVVIRMDPNVTGNSMASRAILMSFVPVILAVFVWLTRILIIGAIVSAGENFLHEGRRTDHEPPGAEQSPPSTTSPNCNARTGKEW